MWIKDQVMFQQTRKIRKSEQNFKGRIKIIWHFHPSLSHFSAPGVIGGKFLERGRVKKPGQELFKSELSEYFTAQDLYVGATLCLNSKDFQLLDADEYTLKYMEQHAEEVGRDLEDSCLFPQDYAWFCIKDSL